MNKISEEEMSEKETEENIRKNSRCDRDKRWSRDSFRKF